MTTQTDNAYDAFEASIEKMLGDHLRQDPDSVGPEIWSSLANVDWYHPENGYSVSYSFRAAGGMIAGIRGEGDYMDWYCSGPYAKVSHRVAHAMRKEGWIYDTIGDICDVDGCINEASCGWPSDDGYRSTCSNHYRGLLSK